MKPRKNWPIKCLIVLACIAVAYVGTFSYWWITSPQEAMIIGGTRIQVRKIHHNNFMAHTQPIWEPAFWYMIHIRGYRFIGYIATFEDSAFVYGK